MLLFCPVVLTCSSHSAHAAQPRSGSDSLNGDAGHAAHARRRVAAPRRKRGGEMAALLARLCRAAPGLRAARLPLAAAAAAFPSLRRPSALPGSARPLSFSASELVRAAPGPLQPYLRLMRLHQPAGERGGARAEP